MHTYLFINSDREHRFYIFDSLTLRKLQKKKKKRLWLSIFNLRRYQKERKKEKIPRCAVVLEK